MMVIRIILYLLIAIIALLLLFITIPFGYRIDGSEKRIRGVLTWTVFRVTYIKWFYGEEELSIGILGYSKKIPVENNRDRSNIRAKRKPRKKSKGINLFRGMKVDIIRQIFVLLRKIVHDLKPRQFILDARVGFEDPMYTGIMYAIYCELYYLHRNYRINIQPEFGKRVFSGKFAAEGRLWILSIVAAFIGFLISPPVSREIRDVLKSKLFSKKGVAGNVRF